jgi:tetratricopeptide repeat protein
MKCGSPPSYSSSSSAARLAERSSELQVVACSVNLASCQGSLGELTSAMSLQRETTARLANTLGTDHPDTLACRANLVVTLHQAGRESEAEEDRALVLEQFNRVLGPGHPDAAQLRSWQWINRDLEPQMI